MPKVETRAEAMGKRARQVAVGLYDWDKIIVPLDELIQEGVNFSPSSTIPPEFKKTGKEVAGDYSQSLFTLFSTITSKSREIAQGGTASGGIYKPYVYDRRDPTSPKVLGLKAGRRGGLERLATLELALTANRSAVTLSVRNTRFPDAPPNLVVHVDTKAVTIKQRRQRVKQDEQWLDEKFDGYLAEVLMKAQETFPYATVTS